MIHYKCEYCGVPVERKQRTRYTAVFCSHSCSAKRIRKTWPQQFWEKVAVVDGDGCWLWTGAIDQQTGYVDINADGRTRNAHRVSWELHNGAITNGLWVLHSCDVRECVRPSHLWLGTAADNNRDMWQKGRGHKNQGVFGEACHLAVMTEAMVVEARHRVAEGETRKAIARSFGVSPSTIALAVNRKTWSHVA